MPVILGVRRSKAQALGWIGAKVTTRDILAAVEGGRLKFLMTSATQSNSGAAAYLAMLAAGIGKPDLIEAGDLDKSEVLATVRGLLRGVERSSGSSGWLADLYREGERTGAQYQAIWNYEAVIKETNDKLVADRKEPLYAIYPEDGVSVGDSPLGFVDRGRGKEVESFFNDLQGFLLKSETQERIAATGRRVELGRAAPLKADATTNLDPSRPLTVVRPPEPAVIQKALALYQEALRRPSLTALCLDVSGSMQGHGEQQLLEAMRFLLTPERTREVLVQWSKENEIIVLPFSDRVLCTETATGDAAAQSRPARQDPATPRRRRHRFLHLRRAGAGRHEAVPRSRTASAGHRHHDRRQEPGGNVYLRAGVACRDFEWDALTPPGKRAAEDLTVYDTPCLLRELGGTKASWRFAVRGYS
jgi:Ca-activated chloride channel family protein